MDKYSYLPLVVCVDVNIPRIDKDGIEKPSGITLGKEYRLLSRYNHMMRIINDEGKKASYIQIRFKPVPLQEIRELKEWKDWMKHWTFNDNGVYSTYEPDNTRLYQGKCPHEAIASFSKSTFGE